MPNPPHYLSTRVGIYKPFATLKIARVANEALVELLFAKGLLICVLKRRFVFAARPPPELKRGGRGSYPICINRSGRKMYYVELLPKINEMFFGGRSTTGKKPTNTHMSRQLTSL